MKTSVSCKVYVIMVILSLGVIFVSLALYRCCCMGRVSDVFLGIGTGGFSSTVVAWLLDISNKKIQENEEKIVFKRMTAEFDAACEELPTEFIVAAQEAHGIDEKKRTFREWANLLLADDNADKKTLKEADYAIQQVTEIKNQANRLLQDSKIHLNNKNVNDGFIKTIKKIRNCCQSIELEHKRGKYKNCLSILVNEMVETLITYNSDMSSLFKEPHNWNEEYTF